MSASNVELIMYKCKNNGTIISDSSAAICGSKCFDTTQQDNQNITLNNVIFKLKLIKCINTSSSGGSLIGQNCFYTNMNNTNPYPPRILKLIDCKTTNGSPLVASFNTTTNVVAYSIVDGYRYNLL